MSAQQVKVLNGEWELQQVIGKGNFGKVYMGYHIPTKRVGAVKCILKRAAGGVNILEEIATLIRLQHPLVARLIDVFENSEAFFMIMELVQGGELLAKLEKKTRFQEDEARKYFAQLVSAVQYCHSQGVAHLDLKPDNVLLGGEDGDTVKVVDFGLAFLLQRDHDKFHEVRGTYEYLAPEILHEADINMLQQMFNYITCGSSSCKNPALVLLPEDRKGLCFTHAGEGSCSRPSCPYDKATGSVFCSHHKCPVPGCAEGKSSRMGACETHLRAPPGGKPGLAMNHEITCTGYLPFPADIWSMGVILYYMVTGKYPFNGPNKAEVFRSIQNGRFSKDHECFKRSPQLLDIIEKMLTMDPKSRPSADALSHHPWLRIQIGREQLDQSVKKVSALTTGTSSAPASAKCDLSHPNHRFAVPSKTVEDAISQVSAVLPNVGLTVAKTNSSKSTLEASADLPKGQLTLQIRFEKVKEGLWSANFQRFSGDISDFHSLFHKIQRAIKGSVMIE
eukprot:NODE_921_length_1687_cov_11.693529_g754_i0.p1 GENE.NODE_921_length_1687_cov_11.693529_g754_i0~~NODE_921_length_1687_cov_11.693529_g754_i0.p1  ORF type:complete len:505 (+),score=130.91 NODE_921_length_1687_cov_11.693529_g754_i0:80-1594(+)